MTHDEQSGESDVTVYSIPVDPVMSPTQIELAELRRRVEAVRQWAVDNNLHATAYKLADALGLSEVGDGTTTIPPQRD